MLVGLMERLWGEHYGPCVKQESGASIPYRQSRVFLLVTTNWTEMIQNQNIFRGESMNIGKGAR